MRISLGGHARPPAPHLHSYPCARRPFFFFWRLRRPTLWEGTPARPPVCPTLCHFAIFTAEPHAPGAEPFFPSAHPAPRPPTRLGHRVGTGTCGPAQGPPDPVVGSALWRPGHRIMKTKLKKIGASSAPASPPPLHPPLLLLTESSPYMDHPRAHPHARAPAATPMPAAPTCACSAADGDSSSGGDGASSSTAAKPVPEASVPKALAGKDALDVATPGECRV